MALVRLDGSPVLAATVHRPLVGAWHADLVVDAEVAPTGAVTLAIADGALTLAGTVVRSGVDDGRLHVRVVGGAGGLGRELAARWYRQITLRSILVDTLTAVGERLSAASDGTVLARTVASWARCRATAGRTLDAAVSAVPGAVWRVLADGTVWVGAPTWPTSLVDVVVLDEDYAAHRMVLATEDPTVDAGEVLEGRRLSAVTYRYAPDRVRVEAWWTSTG
jgi:hypothetical protein